MSALSDYLATHPFGETDGNVPSLLVSPILFVESYGAVGDGTTDDSPAFNLALTAAGVNGGVVQLLPRRYKIAGTLTVPADVQLVGFSAGSATHNQNAAAEPLTTGTTLLITGGSGTSESATPTITAYNGAAIRRLKFYWPNQSRTAVTPTAYPYAVEFANNALADKSGLLEDVELVNAYNGVFINTGRVTVSRLFGQAINKGVKVDNAQDVVRLNDIHFNPYWSYSTPLSDWQRANGIAFDLYRADQIFGRGCFAFNYNIGVQASQSTGGPASGAAYGSFNQSGFDGCLYGVSVSSTSSVVPLSFEDCWFSSPGSDYNAAITGGNVVFNNCQFWGNVVDSIRVVGGNSKVSVQACRFWNATVSGNVILGDTGACTLITANNAFFTGTPSGGIYVSANHASVVGFISEPSLTDSQVNNVSSGVTVFTVTGIGKANTAQPSISTSTGSATYGVDLAGGTPISIANNATATPFGSGATFSGLILVNDPSSSGATAIYIVGGNSVVAVAGSITGFTDTAGHAGTINIYQSGGVVTIENKTGITVTPRVLAIRLRSSI